MAVFARALTNSCSESTFIAGVIETSESDEAAAVQSATEAGTGTRVSLMISHDVKSAPPGTDQIGDIMSLPDIAAILPVGRHA